jgi:hypothetical protein
MDNVVTHKRTQVTVVYVEVSVQNNSPCRNGKCQTACAAGLTPCKGKCIKCSLAGQQCIDGSCQCADPIPDLCLAQKKNGISIPKHCTNLGHSNSDCGTCGHACPSTQVCLAGTCTAACTPSVTCDNNCGNFADDGCGTPLTCTPCSPPPTFVYCAKPSDCATGYCGFDGICHAGSCDGGSQQTQCIRGFPCDPSVPPTGRCTVPECDSSADCTSGQVCLASSSGATCQLPSKQCVDQAQCALGSFCAAGFCIPSCTQDTDCRDGFQCNTVQGICNVPAQTCTNTDSCGHSPSKVCVSGACVPRCGPQGQCQTPGDVCAENGCIPNPSPSLTCTTEGVQDTCQSGSLCLHGSCWISCDSPNQAACLSDPQAVLNQCKPFSSSGTTFNVCGSASSLGSQCGAGTIGNVQCSGPGQICIDGYCK